ncbi:uncharacterized protein LOC5508153 isoform X1 [Nematostella vectensis]|uniref:uncharacterized protein LOC5508153 isoform X1 n=1 Tax=Nematostella vectensis TaxID=45351 RepID=UPI0020776B18|nr:uncharacterized protein LOC5508153 isoform X1 [Nematostella vectensis]
MSSRILKFEVPEGKEEIVREAIRTIEGCREIPTPTETERDKKDDMIVNSTNPKEIVERVSLWLKRNRVSQIQFAKTILGRGQPTLNALLAQGQTEEWPKEGTKRRHYIKMYDFMEDEDLQSTLRLAGAKYEHQRVKVYSHEHIHRPRTRFSDLQLAALDMLFTKTQNPSVEVLEELCNTLHLELAQAQIWFQNKRRLLKENAYTPGQYQFGAPTTVRLDSPSIEVNISSDDKVNIPRDNEVNIPSDIENNTESVSIDVPSMVVDIPNENKIKSESRTAQGQTEEWPKEGTKQQHYIKMDDFLEDEDLQSTLRLAGAKSEHQKVRVYTQEHVPKPRTRFSDLQLAALDMVFTKTPNPSVEVLGELCITLNLELAQAQIWFQNKRRLLKENAYTPGQYQFDVPTTVRLDAPSIEVNIPSDDKVNIPSHIENNTESVSIDVPSIEVNIPSDDKVNMPRDTEVNIPSDIENNTESVSLDVPSIEEKISSPAKS